MLCASGARGSATLIMITNATQRNMILVRNVREQHNVWNKLV